jgi:hypothetical protein
VGRPVACGYTTNVRSPPDRRGAARDPRGRLKRELTEDQILDVVARRVQRQSYRAIEKATGVPKSTAASLCRQPDVQAMIAARQAGIAAAQKEQANAVKRERQREASRKSAAARRERKRQATSPSGPIRGQKDSEDDLDAVERRIAPEWTPLCGVQILDGEGRLLFSRPYDRLDESTLGELANELRAAGVPKPRNAIIEDLANCAPDRRVVYGVEPEPELMPAEEAAHGVFEPLLQPAKAAGHCDNRTELEAEGVIPPLFSEADLAPVLEAAAAAEETDRLESAYQHAFTAIETLVTAIERVHELRGHQHQWEQAFKLGVPPKRPEPWHVRASHDDHLRQLNKRLNDALHSSW